MSQAYCDSPNEISQHAYTHKLGNWMSCLVLDMAALFKKYIYFLKEFKSIAATSFEHDKQANKVHLELCPSNRYNRNDFNRTLFALFWMHAEFHTLRFLQTFTGCKQTCKCGQSTDFLFTVVILMCIMRLLLFLKFLYNPALCHVISF